MCFLKEFYTKYFLLDLADYLPVGMSIRLNEILFFLFFGIGVAALIAGWQRGILYRGMRTFLRHDAIGEEKAKTPSELGLTGKNQKSLLRALRSDGMLRKTIAVRGEAKPTYEEYLASMREKKRTKTKEKHVPEDLSDKAFYLPESEVARAKRIYERGAPSPIVTALFLPMALVVWLGLAFLMPSLLNLISSLF